MYKSKPETRKLSVGNKKKIVDTDLELLNAHGGNDIVTESRHDTREPQRWT